MFPQKKTAQDNSALLPDSISPNNLYIGFMLPYTPLHYLLFFYPIFYNPITLPTPLPSREGMNPSPLAGEGWGEGRANFSALVMTSGNISEEPIIVSNDEAVSKFSDMVDALLIHNRDIFMRVDDSVVRNNFIGHRTKPIFIRRSRGYAPEPISLDNDGPEVSAAELI